MCLNLYRWLRICCMRTSPSRVQYHEYFNERARLGKSCPNLTHGVLSTPSVRGYPLGYTNPTLVWPHCKSDLWNYLAFQKYFLGWCHLADVGCAKEEHPLIELPKSQGFCVCWNSRFSSLVNGEKQHFWREIQPYALGWGNLWRCLLLCTNISSMIGVHWYLTRARWDNIHPDVFGGGTQDRAALSNRLWAIWSDVGITSPSGVIMGITLVSFDGTNLSWSSTAIEDPDCSRKWPAACDWGKRVFGTNAAQTRCAVQEVGVLMHSADGVASGSPTFTWRYPRTGVPFQQTMPPFQHSQIVPHQNKGQLFEISQEKNVVFGISGKNYTLSNFILQEECYILNRKYVYCIKMNISV